MATSKFMDFHDWRLVRFYKQLYLLLLRSHIYLTFIIYFMMIGWLQNIGYGFFSLPGCIGYYGEASSTMDSKMIMSPVSAQIAYQFLMWIAIYSIGFVIANWLGYDVSFVDKEFDDETKHFEYEMANDLLTTHDDFEETKENVYMKHISPRSIMVGIADKDLSYGKIPVVADV